MMLRRNTQFLLCHRHLSAPEVLDQQIFRSVAVAFDTIIPLSAPTEGGRPLHIMPGSADHPVLALVYDNESGHRTYPRVGSPPVDAAELADTALHFASGEPAPGMALTGKGLTFLPQALVKVDLARGA